MKTALILLAVLSVATTSWGQATTTISFSEMTNVSANGLTFKGVTFSFKVQGTNSNDAHFGASGPGTLTYVSDPSLEGPTTGVLGWDFAVPVSHMSFGVALAATTTLTPGVTVSFFDANQNQVNKIALVTRPLISFTEGFVVEDGPPVSHVSIFFNSTAPAFVVDNLTFTTVPEPSAGILCLAGLAAFGLFKSVSRARARWSPRR
jgi:hypothetical protein